MALWQQQSPYLSSSDLAQGFCRWTRKEKRSPCVFAFFDCCLNVALGKFKQGEKVDLVQLDFNLGIISITQGRTIFRGPLGWNVWCKGRCVWNMALQPRDGTPHPTSFLASLFTYGEILVDSAETRFFDCIMSSPIEPFRKGEYVPIIVVNWTSRTIQMFDDPTGRVFEGLLGWCILKHPSRIPYPYNVSLNPPETFTPFSLPPLHLPPPILAIDSSLHPRFLSQ